MARSGNYDALIHYRFRIPLNKLLSIILSIVRLAHNSLKQRRCLVVPLIALLLLDTHAKMPTFTLLDAERCESGRIDMLGKHASRQRDRGFESHPLRHTDQLVCTDRSLPC